MTPAAIIRAAQADGVTLALSPAGTIKATGDGVAVNRWVATIRQHKPELLALLTARRGQDSRSDAPDFDDIQEFIEERAAIMEFDGGLSRQAAEADAFKRAIVRFKLIDNQGGGVVLGAESHSLADLLACLRRRYGERLERAEAKP